MQRHELTDWIAGLGCLMFLMAAIALHRLDEIGRLVEKLWRWVF